LSGGGRVCMIARTMNADGSLQISPDGLPPERRCGRSIFGSALNVLLRLRVFAGCVILAPVLAVAQIDLSSETVQIEALRLQAVAYEFGNGVAKDGGHAAALYCEAARVGDAESQFALGWIYAYGRGVTRDDEAAAFFFRLAADQGIAQASNMLSLLPDPPADVPKCMRDPEPIASAETAAEPVTPPSRVSPAMVALVTKTASEYRVPVSLVWAIMAAESGFNPAALSPKNAQGLMQLIPETASRFRVKDAFDPKQNVRGGVAYLRWLLAYFQGDVSLVAAAYNAGEGAVERYAGVPPYLETRAYVRRIVAAVGNGMQPFDANVVEPSSRLRLIRERQIAR
jgi:hypothetical protein